MTKTTKPHAVLISSPGIGHLIPILKLSQQISSLKPFLSVTVIVVDLDLSQNPNPNNKDHDHDNHDGQRDQNPLLTQLLSTTSCHVIRLPPITPRHVSSDVSDPSSAAIFTLITAAMRAAKPLVREAISGMKVNALIVDLFGTELLELSEEFDIPRKYVYVATSAWFLALTLHVPVLDRSVNVEYVDRSDPVQIPGCRPVQPGDVVDPMKNRSNRQYQEYVKIGVKIHKCDAVLVNTWEDLEPNTLEALRDPNRFDSCPPVHPVGPLVRDTSASTGPVFEWLDRQPKESVIYLSFGSGGTLSFDQTVEIALGLEMSGQRFIWVVRAPTVTTGDSAYLKKDLNKNENDMSFWYLPDGFLGRVGEMGFLVENWAQQSEILGHSSVGGFVTHCGWSSVMEGLMSGVPMLTWPLYAEQRMNGVLLEEIGVGLGPMKVVMRDEIERVLRGLIVGEIGMRMRERVREVRESGKRALERDGSSYNALLNVLNECCGLEG